MMISCPALVMTRRRIRRLVMVVCLASLSTGTLQDELMDRWNVLVLFNTAAIAGRSGSCLLRSDTVFIDGITMLLSGSISCCFGLMRTLVSWFSLSIVAATATRNGLPLISLFFHLIITM